MRVAWQGVFPAATTQFQPDQALDVPATLVHLDRMIAAGIHGLVMLGTVGENCSLARHEKIGLIEAAKDAVGAGLPVILGVAEYTAAFGAELAREAARVDIDGLMVMPAMVYPAKPRETLAHYRAIARASDLPIMVYNNPPTYRTDVTPEMMANLADIDTIVAFKESSGDTRRFVDLRNLTGDRFIPFCGLDDVVVESAMLGAVGWVSGLSNVFPREAETLFRLARAGRYTEAMAVYEWFMPLLHLDARHDLVQAIKFCEKLAGRGSDRTRLPRLPLDEREQAEIRALMETAMATRPRLPDVGLVAA